MDLLHFYDFFIPTNTKSYRLTYFAEFSIDSKFHVIPLQTCEIMGPQTCQFLQTKIFARGQALYGHVFLIKVICMIKNHHHCWNRYEILFPFCRVRV